MRIFPIRAILFVLFISPVIAQVQVNPGTELQTLVSNNPAGTTFLLKSGVHRTRGVAPKDGQRFVGEAGAILSGAVQVTGFAQEGSNWVRYGQTQEAPGRDVGMCYTATRCTYPEDLFIDNRILTHVRSTAELGSGKWFFDYGADKIYVGENPNGKNVELSSTVHAFASSSRDVVIQTLVIEKFANSAQRGTIQPYPSYGGPYGPNWLIQDSEIRYNHGTGIRIGDRMRLVRNNIHHNGQMGVAGGGLSVVLDTNEIAFNNAAGYDYGSEGGGTKFSRTRDLTITGNYVHDNTGPGLHIDIDNSQTIIENNRTRANKVAGIYIELSFFATIRNNNLEDEGFSTFGTELWWGSGILLNGAGDVEIYGNTLTNCANGIGGVQSNRGWSNTFSRNYWVQNTSVHDNTFVNPRYTATGMIRSGDTDDGVYSRNNRWFRNTYRLSNINGSYFQWQGNARTWTQWRAYGFDTDGTVTGLTAPPPAPVPPPTPPPSGTATYLSDLTPTSAINGWGPVEKDKSNNDLAGGDGRVLSIRGQRFTKGLGVHAFSDIRYSLAGKYKTFRSITGIDDEVGGVARGSVVFEVWADGGLIHRSGVMYGNTSPREIVVDVTGKSELRIMVLNGGDDLHYDHADWADARVIP